MMTRREFLVTASGAALAAAARAGAAPSDATPTIPIIDSHVHIVDPTRPQGAPWPPKSDLSIYRPHLPAKFAALTAPYHVLGEVVIEASPWLEDNQWILDQARDHTGIVGFIGHLEPGTPAFAANLRRFAADPIFRGIRLWSKIVPRTGEPAIRRDLDRLAERGLTIDVVNGDDILEDIGHLARRYPKMPIVIDHLPFTKWDGRPEAMRSELAELASCPNVFAKVSYVVRLRAGRNIADPSFYKPGLDVLWDLFGSKRVVYASNWPASARTATYDDIYRAIAPYVATRSRQEGEDFYWRNSIAAYRWVARGAAASLRAA